jgi:hypothetical protein
MGGKGVSERTQLRIVSSIRQVEECIAIIIELPHPPQESTEAMQQAADYLGSCCCC